MANKSITRHLAIIICLLLFFTSLPYLYLWWRTPAGQNYSFVTYINPTDTYVYYDYIKQAQLGRVVFTNYYTAESDWAGIVRPFWLIVGWWGKLIGAGPVLTFHLARIILIILFVGVIYKVMQVFIRDDSQIIFALYFFFFTLGFGWVYLLIKPNFWLSEPWFNAPFGLVAPDAFPFSAMVSSPHFIASWILLVGGISLYFYLWDKNKQDIYKWFLTGVIFAFLFSMHPFYVVTVYSLLLLLLIWGTLKFKNKKIVWQQFVVTGAVSLLFVVYYFLVGFIDWSIWVKANQNFLPSPIWYLTLLSFGPIIFLAIVGSVLLFRQKQINSRIIFLLIWFVVGGLLIYFPVSWQRRLAEGWYFPLVLLSAFVWYWLQKKSKSILFGVLFALVFFLFSFGSIVVIGFNKYIREGEGAGYLYYDNSAKQAGEWLKNSTPANSVILTNDDDLFAKLPFWSDRKIFFAHLVETIFSHAKFNQLVWFFGSDKADDKKYSFLLANNIDFIVFNQDKGELSRFNPFNKKFLKPVWQQGNLIIFAVNK